MHRGVEILHGRYTDNLLYGDEQVFPDCGKTKTTTTFLNLNGVYVYFCTSSFRSDHDKKILDKKLISLTHWAAQNQDPRVGKLSAIVTIITYYKLPKYV